MNIRDICFMEIQETVPLNHQQILFLKKDSDQYNDPVE